MAMHQLDRVLHLTVGCPKCRRESQYPLAMIIERTALPCICGGSIDLAGEEWVAFRGSFANALVILGPLYAKVPD